MDKRLMLAVAGSGKTSYIVKGLSFQKRSLIVTYTDANYENLKNKILTKFNGIWPDNITLYTYFQFLYRFCYKPILSDIVCARGITFDEPEDPYAKLGSQKFYFSKNGFFYSNRLSTYLEDYLFEIKDRMEKYFDEFIIDEIQDIGGRDFNFLEKLLSANINMIFVGDFNQHTYSTSSDGNTNKKLFVNDKSYESKFTSHGFICDKTLQKSWRCSETICTFIREKLKIDIYSNRPKDENTKVSFVTELKEIQQILDDTNIVKLHYRNAASYDPTHKNWGETKGEDDYQDVCVLLNRTVLNFFTKDNSKDLAPITKNKLYVAITRAHRNVYFISEKCCSKKIP